jgi:hypothetical protein
MRVLTSPSMIRSITKPSRETAAGQRALPTDAPNRRAGSDFFAPLKKLREGVDKQDIQSYDWKVRLTGAKPVAGANSRGASPSPAVFKALKRCRRLRAASKKGLTKARGGSNLRRFP